MVTLGDAWACGESHGWRVQHIQSVFFMFPRGCRVEADSEVESWGAQGGTSAIMRGQSSPFRLLSAWCHRSLIPTTSEAFQDDKLKAF